MQTVADGKAYRNAYTYENDRIKTVAHNTTTNTEDVTYTFEYDELERKTSVKVGTQKLSTNAYKSTRSDLLSSVSYGNGGRVSYTYDAFDRLVGVKHDNDSTDRYTYEYGANGQAAIVRDNNLGRVLQTECDLAERPMGTQLRDANGNLLYRTVLDYDKQNRLVGFGEAAGDAAYKTEYSYDDDNRVTAQSFDGTASVSYVYDDLGRVSTRTAGTLTSTYGYVAGGHGANSTTPLVASISQGSIPFNYAYDNRGNIISETRNGVTTTYSYDALGQLIRVNDPVQNQTWVFNYDRGGNLTSRVRYAYTTGTVGTALETIPYVYGDSNWKDKLTSYNGKAITYDAIGNPLTFDGWTYTWQVGRQLAGMSRIGATLSFKYDHNGLRTQKVVQTNWLPETTNYFLHGKLITHMTVDYSDLNETAHTDVLHFFYDAQSRPAQVKYNGVIYTYIHNLQGDIVGLLDSTGALVVEYKYDAWGKPISITGNLADTLGKRNPFRYRGYVYDEETGLYYLRSRYYNPEVGRFINADTLLGRVGGLGSHNAYAYCANMPVIAADPSGREAIGTLVGFGELAKAIAGAAASVGAGVGMLAATVAVVTVGVRGIRALCRAIASLTISVSYDAPRAGSSASLAATSAGAIAAALSGTEATRVDQLENHFEHDYYIAFGKKEGDNGFIYAIPIALNAGQAVTMMRASAVVNALLKDYGASGVYGIYTPTKEGAMALEALIGGFENGEEPDFHGNKAGANAGQYFYHFHDKRHTYHIWYGVPINIGVG